MRKNKKYRERFAFGILCNTSCDNHQPAVEAGVFAGGQGDELITVSGRDTGVVKGIALTAGMSSTDLAALGETIKTAMPLFETKYLTVDQKGNSREGKTVMGAFVGQ